MKTITLTAWRRPEYTRRVLQALSQVRGAEEWQLFISIDGGHKQVLRICLFERPRNFRNVWYRVNDPPITIPHLRAAEHAREAYDWAFSEGSQFNLAIEDDTVLSPDAIELAEWFYHRCPERDAYLHLSLGHAQKLITRPLDVCESDGIMSPWALAFTKEAYERVIRPTWNCKRVEPLGWDWSLTYTMARRGMWSLHPFLARALNIGREGGAHAIPESWDKEFVGCVASDGSHGNDYRIPGQWPRDDPRIRDWMVAEIEADEGRPSAGTAG